MGIRQIKALTLGRMKARYRKTFAGMIWVALNPILMFSAQSLVFKHILKIEVKDFPLFLMGGLLPWIFITSNIDMCTSIIVSSSDLLKSFKINPIDLVLSQIMDNFFNFLLSFFILLIPSLFIYKIPFVSLLLLPFGFLLLIAFSISLCTLLALLNVFYRDIKFVSSFVMSILFFITPIFYPESIVPENLKLFMRLNPFYAVIKPIRFAIYELNTVTTIYYFLPAIFTIFCISLLTLLFWGKKKNDIYLHL